MEQRIVNKERSILFIKENPKNQFWRMYLLENHPLYTGDDTVRGGLIDDPDSISWDSWLDSDVIVDRSKILNGSRIEGYFEIRGSTLSNLVIRDAKPETYPSTSNVIHNSTLNFHALVEIYLAQFILIGNTLIDGYVDISKVEGLVLKNSCLTGSIDLGNCYELLELEDCFFNGNLIFDCENYKWDNVKIEGNQIIK
jgi:hypothetical protein